MSNVLETRAQFCQRYFKNELSVYESLSAEQGNQIPICYGQYMLSYDDREIEEDRQISVLLVQVLEGNRLSECDPRQYTLDQKRQVCRSVNEICATMHHEGIL